MRTRNRIRVLGLLSLPLLAIAIAVMIFAFGSNTGTAQAVGQTGQLMAEDLIIDGAALPEIGLDAASLQPDGAQVTENFSGFTPGLGGWNLAITYDDDFVSTVDISLATTVFDDGTIAGVSLAVIDVDGNEGRFTELAPAGVIDNPTTDNISGLGLTTDEGLGVLPALYVTILGLILLAIVVAMSMRTQGAFATGFLSGRSTYEPQTHRQQTSGRHTPHRGGDDQ